jgi:FkbM family methyltransferase
VRRALVRLLAAGGVLAATGGLLLFAVRHTASPRAVYELDTRLWFLQLKMRGDAPHVGWPEALRRVGPEWPRRNRYDLAQPIDRGAAPCPVLWETPLGRFWGGEKDGRELDLLSLEQAGGDIYQRRRVTVRDSDIVFDIGAHLGTFTRVALLRGARLVVAFEPNPVNAACFAKTFAAEIGKGRVRLVKAAVWHSAGSLTFDAEGSSQTGHISQSGSPGSGGSQGSGGSGSGGSGSRGSSGSRALEVRAVTLDQIVDELRLDRVDFIKMDIEGAERHALAGARRLLAEHKPRLAICIYHAPDDPDVVPRAVRAGNPAYRSFTRGAFQAYFH